jgi:hypothetical protein
MAEEMGGATAANAVANFAGPAFHHAFAPGAHEGGQKGRGVSHLFHVAAFDRGASLFVQGKR